MQNEGVYSARKQTYSSQTLDVIIINDYSLEMGVSRFVREGSLEAYMSYVKSITTKPVVTVGRFTSVSTWGDITSEQERVQKRLIELGVRIITTHSLAAYDGQRALINCVYSGNTQSIDAESIVSVNREPPFVNEEGGGN